MKKFFFQLKNVVWLALLLRLAYLTFGHTYRPSRIDGTFGMGWETGRIASAIASGHGFSDPFYGHTGPTAWIAPVYPYLLALIFKLFGVYTPLSSWVALALNSLFSALTCIPVYRIAERCFGKCVAQWSALLWAVLPYAMYWAVRAQWETSLTALLLAMVLWVALQLRDRAVRGISSRALWIELGILWGLLALSNPSVLLFLPSCGLWIVWKNPRTQIANALMAATIFLLMIAPWTARNYLVFGKLVPLRGNFGAEFRMGNGPGADGLWLFYLHPVKNEIEFAHYRQMGEPAYVRSRLHEALVYVKTHPARFAVISVKRFVYFWYGTPRTQEGAAMFWLRNILFFGSSLIAFLGLLLCLKRREFGSGLFAWLLFSVPLIYYITYPLPRYRHPIEPEMLILGVYLFQRAERKAPRRENRESQLP